MGEFISHFQTAAGSSVTFPEFMLKAGLRVTPRIRIGLQHYRGTSPFNNGFQASVGDFEGRVLYRLDDPSRVSVGDSPFQNIHGWVSWHIWSSTDKFGGANFRERDEGAGFGFSRGALRRGLSYWYSFALYPSVRTQIGDAVNAYTVEGGPVVNFSDTLAAQLGYRLQTLKTGLERRNRAQEQGFTLGLRGSF